MTDNNEGYGKLVEGLHIAGYAFERAMASLEFLLTDTHWTLGGRFANVDDFLSSLRFDQFRPVAEQRKRIAQRIRELQPAVSNRQIARTLGVDHKTVGSDLTGENSPPPRDNAVEIEAHGGENSPASSLTGEQAAKLVRRKETGTAEKQQQREKKERMLGAKQAALPDRRYGVIVADPEWRFEPWSRSTGVDRAAENHYPTSCTEVIAARDVPSIAADECVLFLWATGPMIPHALVVMAAWGFDYKAQYIWGKDKAGTGFWNREKHELLLIGTRGNVPCPAPGTQWDSLIIAPRGEHSAKPECFLEMVEQYFPNLPKIELNRRGAPRLGWDAWGNELTAPTPSTGMTVAAEMVATDEGTAHTVPPAAIPPDSTSAPLDVRTTLRPGIPNFLVRVEP